MLKIWRLAQCYIELGRLESSWPLESCHVGIWQIEFSSLKPNIEKISLHELKEDSGNLEGFNLHKGTSIKDVNLGGGRSQIPMLQNIRRQKVR